MLAILILEAHLVLEERPLERRSPNLSERAHVLDQQARNRIFCEEVYREEVRRDIEAKRTLSKSERFWRFLNSSFGMWILTTVIAGGVVWALTTWRDSRRMHDQRRQTIQRLDTEIATRLDRLAIRLPVLRNRRQLSEAIEALDQPGSSIYGSTAYPEYAGWSLLALVRDLRENVPSSDLLDVDKALRASLILARLGARSVSAQLDSSTAAQPLDQVTFAEAKAIVDDSLRIHRWVYARIQP